jgi:hypothetical protein
MLVRLILMSASALSLLLGACARDLEKMAVTNMRRLTCVGAEINT